MQRKLFMTMLAVLAMLLNAHADAISVDDVHLLPGGQAQVTVRLHSSSNRQYAGWQMDFRLPDGISAIANNDNNLRLQGQLGDCCDETFSLYSAHLSNGTDRWASFPASDIIHTFSVSGNDILFTFPITAAETLTSGTTLKATVEDILFSNTQGTRIYMSDVTFNITIDEELQPWAFDLQASLDSIATSANHGTSTNPVEIHLPNEYLISSPITVHDKVFIRLTGGTLKLSNTFDVSQDYVFLIEGSPSTISTLFLKDVTIDANSKALHYSFFKIQGDLYVESGVTYKNINTQTGKDNGAFYLNEGTLYIQSGSVNVAGTPIRGGGYTYIQGGVLKGSSCVNMNGDWVQGDGLGSGPSVVISGGELVATDIAIIPLESTYSGGATISGGKVTAPTLINDGSYCRLFITGGILDITHLIKLNDIYSISGSEVFVKGNVDLNVKMNIGIYATSTLTKPWLFDCSSTNFNTIYLDTGGLHYIEPNAPFEEKTLVVGYDYQLQKADFEKMTFTGVPDTLEVYYNEENYSVKVRLKDHSEYEGMLGDVNNDGVVSISDAICIISWLQENMPPVFIEGAADYNKDGGITVSDALAIIRTLLNDEDEPSTFIGEAIDLGLPSGVKWASCNVGATSPEEIGGYYAWGEIEEKNGSYDESTYNYYHSSFDNLGANISGTNYDVAHIKWGGTWRMPTKDDFDELIKHCSLQYSTLNNVNGITFVGPNGNSIFLPTAGFRRFQGSLGIHNGEKWGYYWTSTQTYYQYEYCAYNLFINYQSYAELQLVRGFRTKGLLVRPVTE